MLRGIQHLAESITTLNGERAQLMNEKEHLMVERDGFASTLATRDKGQQLIRRLEWKLPKSRIEVVRLNSIILERGQPDKYSMSKSWCKVIDTVLGSVKLAVPAAGLCGRPVLAAVCVRSEEGSAYYDAVFVAADDTPGIAAEPEGMASMFLLVELNFACAMATSFLSRSYTKYADRMNESPRISVSTSSLWSPDSIAMLSWHAGTPLPKVSPSK